MIRPSVVVLGIAGTLVVALLAVVLFLRHLVVKSFPATEGKVAAAGLRAPVDIHRDSYGVPHILAADREDLMFAAGYAHAQDRLWQMDLSRRAGEGRLSELLGRKTLELDVMFRTIGIDRIAARMEERLSPESRAALEAYAAGVNAVIGSQRGAYPAEFDMLGYEPEPWTVRHSLIVSRLIAWELALSWWTDLVYGAIGERVPEAMVREILPQYPDSVRPTVPSRARRAEELRRAAPRLAETGEDARPANPAGGASVPPGAAAAGAGWFLAAGDLYRDMFGAGEIGGGSNAWVVNASRSESGYPLLANDPHLGMPQPSRWYLMHLSWGDRDVSGVTIPGLPVVVIGHTGATAWGFTNAMLDDCDFYVERADTSRPGHYLHEGRSLRFDERPETIRIDGGDSVEIVVRSTVHGPIVNEAHPVTDNDSVGRPAHMLAMRWTGAEPSDEVRGFLRMNAAAALDEFESGLADLSVPGQAVVYADTAGNIAYWTAGRVPIRDGKHHPMLPLPGWTGEAEWRGFAGLRDLPRMTNPPDGVIACANQRIGDDAPGDISSLWEPPSRIQRIRELLQGAAQFSADDFKRMQQDVVSHHARELTGLLMAVAGGHAASDTVREAALDYLRNWDFRFTTNDVATTIFNAFYVSLLRNIYLDEMGAPLYSRFLEFGAIPNRVTAQLLASDSSRWFDRTDTPRRESRDDILLSSFAESLDTLRQALGPVMKEWRWGNLHTVTFRHPFGSRQPLDRVFDVGPFEVAGGGTTLWKTEYKNNLPYAVKVGPSMRQVVDLSRPMEGAFVLTGGQSGQAFHRHYEDQTALWLNGGYLRVTMDHDEIASSPWDRLTLEPAR